MITLRELVEQQRGRLPEPEQEEQEQCYVEEDEDLELSHEQLAEIKEAINYEMGELENPMYSFGEYHSGTMQKDRVPKYGPGKVKKNGECIY